MHGLTWGSVPACPNVTRLLFSLVSPLGGHILISSRKCGLQVFGVLGARFMEMTSMGDNMLDFAHELIEVGWRERGNLHDLHDQ